MPTPARVAAEAAAADSALAALAEAAQAGTLTAEQLRGPLPNVSPMPTLPANDPPPPAPPVANDPPPPAPPPQPPQDPTPPLVQPTNNDLQYQRMQQALATAEGRLQAQNQQMTELQRQIEEIRNPPAPPARLYDDTDVEAFGAENVDLVQRIVRQEFGSRLDAFDRTLNEMRGTMQRLAASTQQVQAQTQLSAAEKFDAKLAELVPDWEALNVDPRFLDWLEKVDIVSNQKYGELLVDAYRQGQAERTAHFFNLYKKDAGIAPATPAPTPPPAPPTGVDPTAFIAPAAGAPTPPPTQPGQPRIWTMAEGDKIYEDFRRGLIKKPEFERQEREYVQAAKEGRVRP